MNNKPVSEWTDAEVSRWMAERDGWVLPDYHNSLDAAVGWLGRMGLLWSRYSGPDTRSWVFVCPDHTCYESPTCSTARALCNAGVQALMRKETTDE